VLVAARAADEADALVPQADQVLDHASHAGGVIGFHGGEGARPRGSAGHHGKRADRLQAREPRILEADVGEQEAVDAPAATSRS
jgi:hypothetical protein